MPEVGRIAVTKAVWEGFHTGYFATMGQTTAFGATRREAVVRLETKLQRSSACSLPRLASATDCAASLKR